MTLARRIIRKKDLPNYLGVKRTAIDDLIKSGALPPPIRLTEGGRAVGWFEDDIAAYQEKRAAERNREQSDR